MSKFRTALYFCADLSNCRHLRVCRHVNFHNPHGIRHIIYTAVIIASNVRTSIKTDRIVPTPSSARLLAKWSATQEKDPPAANCKSATLCTVRPAPPLLRHNRWALKTSDVCWRSLRASAADVFTWASFQHIIISTYIRLPIAASLFIGPRPAATPWFTFLYLYSASPIMTPVLPQSPVIRRCHLVPCQFSYITLDNRALTYRFKTNK